MDYLQIICYYYIGDTMKDKRGFTLVELLAVIIILAILMLVAIPSVSNYIVNSRKEAYIQSAKQVVTGVVNLVNANKFDLYDQDTTYYIPASCAKLESGGQSSFGGKWEKNYVVVTFTGEDFDYYYTALDSTKTGNYITYSDKLEPDKILTGLDKVPTDICIGERDRIVYFDEKCDGTYRETYNVRHLVKDQESYDPENSTDMFQIRGVCKFNGKDGVVEGDGCSEYNGQVFIDTELKLFSQKNATKDFYIYFDIVRMDPSDQDSGSQWTLLANKLERGEYPGFCFRFAGNRLEFTQKIQGKKLATYYNIGEAHSLKLFRKDRVLYYSINGEPLQVFQDTSNFTDYFDSTLYIGAAQDGSGKPFRWVNATISNLVVKMGDIKNLLADANLHTIFHLPGECTFNGQDGVLEGEGCGQYAGQKYMDTGLKLFSNEYKNKDFQISFNIVDYDYNAQDPGTDQNTFMSTKSEVGTTTGLKVRKNGKNVETLAKFNNVSKNSLKDAAGAQTIKILKSNGVIYVMYNYGKLTKLIEVGSLNEVFDDTLWFGAARDGNGQPFRYVKATLSNITIQSS